VFRWFSEDYDFFYVESESSKYVLRTSQTAVGDAGDAINSLYDAELTPINGMPFSSWDADNDRSSINCAVETGGGWWHNRCGSSRLLGDRNAYYLVGYLWRELETAAPSEGNGLNASFMLVTAVG
jgi:hypothetical protein